MGDKCDENDRLKRVLNKVVFRAYDAKYAGIYASVRSKPSSLQAGELGGSFTLLGKRRFNYLIDTVSEDGAR